MGDEKYPKSERKSVRVFAKKYGVSAQIMNALLKDQGRQSGEPGDYRINPEYKEYQHISDNGGYSYDKPFFEGLTINEETLKKAKELYEKMQDEKQKRSDDYYANLNKLNSGIPDKQSSGLLTRLLQLFLKIR